MFALRVSWKLSVYPSCLSVLTARLVWVLFFLEFSQLVSTMTDGWATEANLVVNITVKPDIHQLIIRRGTSGII
jgi:hypothetical protein